MSKVKKLFVMPYNKELPYTSEEYDKSEDVRIQIMTKYPNATHVEERTITLDDDLCDKELSPLQALEIVKHNLSEDATSDLPNALNTIETALKDPDDSKKDEILRIVKKFVYVCGQEGNKHLAFRSISQKKHTQDFEKMVKFLEE